MKKTKVITDEKLIDEVLSRGVVDLIVRDHLKKRMMAGECLRIKFGIDPTSPHLHLGHTVPLRKLRQFQDLGHQAVLIIGDATAKIGDPTGRSEARKMLTDKEIKVNKKSYVKQASKILDIDRVEVRHNSEWFGKMNATEFLGLCSLVSVQQIMQREDFRARVNDPDHPLKAIELTYPVMQGYDSVMVKADVEIGGVDQLLNLHMGRRYQGKFGQMEQDILTVALIEGTDGERKMSKSFGNAIALQDEPSEMYGKIMTIPDSLIIKYFELITAIPSEEIAGMKIALEQGINPRELKVRLAMAIVTMFHSAKAAEAAAKGFDAQFRDHQVPTDLPVLSTGKGKMGIIDVLVESGLVASRGEARRQIEQGGVKVDGEVVTDINLKVVGSKDGVLVQKGKRFFVKLVL